MTNPLRITLLTLSLLGAAPAALAADDDLKELQDKLGTEWTPIRVDRLHNMKTYGKQEDGKRFRSFKVEGVFEGTVTSVVRLLLDFDHYDHWSWEVMNSRLLKKVSPTEYILYVTHRAPYGVPNRDIALRMVFEPQTAAQPFLVVKTSAVPDFLPVKPPFVRMLAEDMSIRVMPLPGHKVQITSEGYIDPGGNMATWAINFVQRNVPYITLLGINRMIQNHAYADGEGALPFPVQESL